MGLRICLSRETYFWDDFFARAIYDDFKKRDQARGNAGKNFSCEQIQFMKVRLTSNTRAVIKQQVSRLLNY